MEITFESIKTLIVSEVWEGNQVRVKFKATNQTEPIESMGVAMADPAEMQKKLAAEMAKSMASNIAVSAGAGVLGSLTGVSGAGSAINNAASSAGVGYTMDPSKLMEVELTDEVKQKTILNAFSALSSYYQFENGAWSFKMPTA